MSNLKKMSGKEFLHWLAQQFKPDQPLEPEDPLYEPIYKDEPTDPVALILRDIEFAEIESLNLISGFRGAGKTTELYRLRKKLRDGGHFVAYANALDYLLPAEPVEISDFLMVLAGAFSEAVESDLKIDPLQEGWWTRLYNWLTKTHVQLNGIEAKGNVPGTDVGLNLKMALKEDPSFRQKLRAQMMPRLGELRNETQKFLADTLRRIKKADGPNPVFIFDSLEQLRDTLTTKGAVADSVVTLFANHRRDFQLPSMHVVLTAPPWLKFLLPDLKKVRLLYNVKLWNNNDKRSRSDAGWKSLHRILERRFTTDGLERYFGSRKGKATDLEEQLIDASGGHFRDLIYLVRETLLRADPEKLPVNEQVVNSAIASYRDTFLPIPLADAAWLHEIGADRDSLLKDRSNDSVQRMTFFLDNHLALILKNGNEWYDIHPIIRDEIAEIVKREAKAKKAKQHE